MSKLLHFPPFTPQTPLWNSFCQHNIIRVAKAPTNTAARTPIATITTVSIPPAQNDGNEEAIMLILALKNEHFVRVHHHLNFWKSETWAAHILPVSRGWKVGHWWLIYLKRKTNIMVFHPVKQPIKPMTWSMISCYMEQVLSFHKNLSIAVSTKQHTVANVAGNSKISQ